MAFEVVQGAFATLGVRLQPGETVQAESDACVTRTASVVVEGKMSGGLLGGLARSIFTGETLFLQQLRCDSGEASGEAVLAPKYPGNIGIHELLPEALLIRQGAFLAASSGVDVTTKALLGRQFLLRGSFSGTGLFCLRAVGQGKVVFSSCGAILRYDLGPGEERIVDNDHVVAWTESLDYRIAFGSQTMWHSATSGEGLSCFFKGPGTVYVQSHAPKDAGAPGRPHAHSNSGPLGLCIFCLFAGGMILMVVFVVILQIMSDKRGRIEL